MKGFVKQIVGSVDRLSLRGSPFFLKLIPGVLFLSRRGRGAKCPRLFLAGANVEVVLRHISRETARESKKEF